jgi:nucleotide-binding universal stress UspA family protein
MARGSVVVGVDGSEQSLIALDWAVETAQLEGRGLHLVHAHGRRSDVARGRAVLEAARQRVLLLDPAVRVTSAVVDGSGESALIVASREADLVCVGTHGRSGFRPPALGSTARSVVASARCPVAVVPRPDVRIEPARRVVVGVDEGSGSHDAIGYAFAQADLRGLPLTAVHAWHAADRIGIGGLLTPSAAWQTLVGNEEAAMAESLAGWSEKYPDVEVSRVSIHRPPAGAVLTLASDAVLIVLGVRHPRPRPDLFGSPTVRRVLRDAVSPVVVVPQALS